MNQLQTTQNFSPEQVSLIKSQIALGATDDELKLFLYQCQRTQLDPLTRQIYFVKRGGRMTIQTSIDGFRVIAERSKVYAGQDEPVYAYDEKGELLKCSVTVYKFSADGQRYPAATGVAFYKEYYPNPMNLQKTLKHTMIAKVAEALALRKAFPQDLSGLYTTDEMHQAQGPTEEMKEELIASLIDLEMEDEKRKIVFDTITSCQDLTQFAKIKARLSQYQPKGVVKEIIETTTEEEVKNQIKKLDKKLKNV